MKTKLLISTMLIFLFSTAFTVGQTRTDYDVQWVSSGGVNELRGMSATYWNNSSWLFLWDYYAYNDYILRFTDVSIDQNGNINAQAPEFELYPYFPATVVPQVTSCVFEGKLWAFWYNTHNKLNYASFDNAPYPNPQMYSSDINISTAKQMAAIGVKHGVNNDLYLFYVDDTDNLVKYFKGQLSEDGNSIDWLFDEPIIISDEEAIGNVAVCSYFTHTNDELIMIGYGNYANKIRLIKFYNGVHWWNHEKYCVENFLPRYITLSQASVKGGNNQAYNIQVGYTNNDNNNPGLFRCELDVDNGTFSNWETLPQPPVVGDIGPVFFSYYVKSSDIVRKHLYLLYAYNANFSRAIHWESDKLIKTGSVTETAPVDFKNNFWDLIAVVEGPPPYALNGNILQSIDVPSTFYFGQEQTYTVSTTTTYTQSIEASAGVGPVTAGFKAAFQQSSGTSSETSLSIVTTITPPVAQNDSCGLMVYFYVAPSLERTEWKLCDYNSDTLIHSRSLFFFQFTEPQLKFITKRFTEFPDSPYLSDLQSYEGRNVQFMPGMEMLYRKELEQDIAGGISQNFYIDFTNTITQSESKSFDVSLGINAEYLIFSASGELTAGVEYERERTSTMSHSFELAYDNPYPANPDDSMNIAKYTTVAYIMKTTDSTAYYLVDDFEQYKPLFITYEVKDIEHGAFLYSIDENSANKDKYTFFNYPNPCSYQSTFTYSLPGKSHINLSIYNIYGQRVSNPVNEIQMAGEHQFNFYTSDLANGIYYYQLLIDRDLITGKMIVSR